MPEAINSGSGSGAAAITTGSADVAEPVVKFGGDGTDHGADKGREGQEGQGATEVRGDDTEVVQGVDEVAGAGEFGDEADEWGDAAADETKYTEPFPKDLQEKLKDAPPLLKQAKRWYFENGRYKAIPGLETPETARELVDRIEGWGGVEGIERETGEAANLYKMLGAGEVGVLDALEKEYSDGLAKLGPAFIDRFQKLDPAGWNHKMATTFMATVTSSGMVQALETLGDLKAVQDSPEAKKLIEKIVKVVNAVNEHAVNAPTRDLSPDQKKLDARAQELSQKENALYQKGVAAQVVPVMKQAGIAALKAVLGNRQLNQEARTNLLADLNLEYSTLAKQDAAFQKNAKALLAANETEKFIKLVKSNIERTMPLAARRVWRKYAGISGLSKDESGQRKAEGQNRREAGGGGAPSNTIKVAKTPAAGDVDWGRMRAEFGRDKAEDMFLFQHKFYKKGDAKNTYTY